MEVCSLVEITNILEELDASMFRRTSIACTYVSTSHGNNKEFLCITHTVEHNYISASSTVGIQLHVSVLYVGHLQVVICELNHNLKMANIQGRNM